MLRRKIRILLIAMATFAFAAPGEPRGAQAREVAIDQQAAGSTVILRTGQRLKVTLEGNPTTGFVWEIAQGAESILPLQGEPHFARASAALGAPGSYSFVFKAVAPGTTGLRLIYHRPFEKDAAPARSFEVTVVIRD